MRQIGIVKELSAVGIRIVSMTGEELFADWSFNTWNTYPFRAGTHISFRKGSEQRTVQMLQLHLYQPGPKVL